MTKEDLLPEVQQLIHKLLRNMEIKKYTIKTSPGSSHGDNYLGVMAKVQVEGSNEENENVNLNLMVKSAPRSGYMRDTIAVRDVYAREIYMYSKVFPMLKEFQEEKDILKPFNSYAKYYASTMDDFNETVIMQDMKEAGYKLCDRHEPLNVDHLMLVMKEYGKLHGLSFGLRDQKPQLFKEISKNLPETFFNNSNLDLMYETTKLQSQKALDSLDPIKNKVAYEKYKSYQSKMNDLTKQAIQEESAGEYGVISHGDCWMNNMLFKYENLQNIEVPIKVCLLDWQLSRISSPALDLSYFLFTNSDKKTRDEHYERLIQTYYESLSTMLLELGSNPEKIFPFDVLQEHLKKFSVFGLYMATMALSFITSEADEIPDLNSKIDAETLINDMQVDSKNIDKYRDRIRGVILDFVKFEYAF